MPSSPSPSRSSSGSRQNSESRRSSTSELSSKRSLTPEDSAKRTPSPVEEVVLFVGGLDKNTTETYVRNLFSPYGTISMLGLI